MLDVASMLLSWWRHCRDAVDTRDGLMPTELMPLAARHIRQLLMPEMLPPYATLRYADMIADCRPPLPLRHQMPRH